MNEQQTSLLFSLQSSGFKIKKTNNKDFYRLKLVEPQNGLLFGDRPKRNASAVSMTELAAQWDTAFRGDPPNAVLAFSNDETMTRAVFEINKFKLVKNKISAKISFSGDQKIASRKFLKKDYLTGKRVNYDSSLFIDSFWNWTSADSSVVVKNQAGDGPTAGMGMMTINWSNAGNAEAFESTKEVISLANGNSTPDGCNPSMAGSTTDSYDVSAEIFFPNGNTDKFIDKWWVSDPDFGHPWISNTEGATKYYSDGNIPFSGTTVVGNFTYPWTVNYEYHACDGNYDQWSITYGTPYSNDNPPS